MCVYRERERERERENVNKHHLRADSPNVYIDIVQLTCLVRLCIVWVAPYGCNWSSLDMDVIVHSLLVALEHCNKSMFLSTVAFKNQLYTIANIIMSLAGCIHCR